jgi:hypothetical protein
MWTLNGMATITREISYNTMQITIQETNDAQINKFVEMQ